MAETRSIRRSSRTLAGGILSRAAATCGSVQIRNMATLGGNMANGSPAADMATPLLALDAAVVMADARGRGAKCRWRNIWPRRAAAGIAEVAAGGGGDPRSAATGACGWSFQKLGRTEMDISLVNVAAGLQLDARGRVKWARIALGAVAPTPMRVAGAEAADGGAHAGSSAARGSRREAVMREVQSH